mmetsp:Transcript_105370/g.304805  ORF Transcript_105370/g.304805 Transcript_105370/m.304805 type:complete len:294 (-) Transcript_105370:92-973(-)
MTSTRMITRRVVMSDNFFPTRVSASDFGFGGGFCCSRIGARLFLRWVLSSPSSSSSSLKMSSSSSSSASSPGPSDERSTLPRRLPAPSLCSKAVLYVLYNLASRSKRIMRTVRAALAPARPALLVFRAPPLPLSPVLQASSSQTQVRSNSKVTVAPKSSKKKNPRKYSSLPNEAATSSVVNTRIQKTVITLNRLSITWWVAANLKSSPKSAYTVSDVVSALKRQLSDKARLRRCVQSHSLLPLLEGTTSSTWARLLAPFFLPEGVLFSQANDTDALLDGVVGTTDVDEGIPVE